MSFGPRMSAPRVGGTQRSGTGRVLRLAGDTAPPAWVPDVVEPAGVAGVTAADGAGAAGVTGTTGGGGVVPQVTVALATSCIGEPSPGVDVVHPERRLRWCCAVSVIVTGVVRVADGPWNWQLP